MSKRIPLQGALGVKGGVWGAGWRAFLRRTLAIILWCHQVMKRSKLGCLRAKLKKKNHNKNLDFVNRALEAGSEEGLFIDIIKHNSLGEEKVKKSITEPVNIVLQNSVTFTCSLEAKEGGSQVWKFSSMRSLLIVSLHFAGIDKITTQVPNIFRRKLVCCKKIVVHTAIQLFIPLHLLPNTFHLHSWGHYPCSRHTENF